MACIRPEQQAFPEIIPVLDLYFCWLFNDAFSFKTTRRRMTDERRTGDRSEDGGVGLNEVLYKQLPGETENNQGKARDNLCPGRNLN
jgi:hypothetical protein